MAPVTRSVATIAIISSTKVNPACRVSIFVPLPLTICILASLRQPTVPRPSGATVPRVVVQPRSHVKAAWGARGIGLDTGLTPHHGAVSVQALYHPCYLHQKISVKIRLVP